MPSVTPWVVILTGAVGGFASGVLGIGGGVILVPLLVFYIGLGQHQAQGTTLAMLCLPTGFSAAVIYYQRGYVDWRIALLLFCGFVIGGFAGGQLAIDLPQRTLQKLFGIAMIAIGAKMIYSR